MRLKSMTTSERLTFNDLAKLELQLLEWQSLLKRLRATIGNRVIDHDTYLEYRDHIALIPTTTAIEVWEINSGCHPSNWQRRNEMSNINNQKVYAIKEYSYQLGSFSLPTGNDLLTVYVRDVMGQRFLDVASGNAQTVIATMSLDNPNIDKNLAFQKERDEESGANLAQNWKE